MLILFGTKRTNKELGDSYSMYKCTHCDNERPLKVIKNRLWFTLFFIPVIPLSTKYYCVCPICNFGSKVKKQEALELMAEPVTVESTVAEADAQDAIAAIEASVEKDNSNMFAE